MAFNSLIDETYHSADFLSSYIKTTVKLRHSEKATKFKKNPTWFDITDNNLKTSLIILLIFWPSYITTTVPFLRSMLLKVGLSSLFSLCYATPLALCIAGVCSSRSGVHTSLSLCRSLKNSVPSLRGH